MSFKAGDKVRIVSCQDDPRAAAGPAASSMKYRPAH